MIYLDNQSTTAVDPRVLESMMPFFSERFGNPSSVTHALGWTAEASVEVARAQVASLLNCNSKEIYFTSGATESNNLVLKGIAENAAPERRQILISNIEHASVLGPCEYLAKKGFEIILVSAGKDGIVHAEAVLEKLSIQTLLVSVMSANNEIGSLNPIEEIGAVCRKFGAYYHVDAAQTVGKTKFDLLTSPIDFLSLSAHKFYGPKGVGALFVRGNRKLETFAHGGGQERGLRSGTLNTPGIVGLGAAALIAKNEMHEESLRISSLRDFFWSELKKRIKGVALNGHPTQRMVQNLSVRFDGIEALRLAALTKDVAFSTGSACGSAKGQVSNVLKAIGLSDKEAQSTARFGLGRWTTKEELVRAAELIENSVASLRSDKTL